MPTKCTFRTFVQSTAYDCSARWQLLQDLRRSKTVGPEHFVLVLYCKQLCLLLLKLTRYLKDRSSESLHSPRATGVLAKTGSYSDFIDGGIVQTRCGPIQSAPADGILQALLPVKADKAVQSTTTSTPAVQHISFFDIPRVMQNVFRY